MLGVVHKHRYFRIQVMVSMAASVLAYALTAQGLAGPGLYDNAPTRLGLSLYTIGPVLAAAVGVYFQRGDLAFWPLIGGALALYAVLWGGAVWIASVGYPAQSAEQQMYFSCVHLIAIAIFAGFGAWLGKALGWFTLLALIWTFGAGQSQVFLLAPILALLDVTSVPAQWAVAIVITASSFLADR